MTLYSKLRSAMREVILYVVLGSRNYGRLKSELSSLQSYSQIKPQNPLEEAMLKGSDICEHLMTLYMLTKQMKLASILELGVRTGESTIALLSAARAIEGTVTSIDIMDCPEARSRIAALELSKWWRFVKGDDLLVELNDNSIGHLFIDTAHTYEQTLKELQKFEPLVSVGGIITLHDIVSFPGVLQAVSDYLVGRNDLQLYRYFNNNGLAVIFKGNNRRKG